MPPLGGTAPSSTDVAESIERRRYSSEPEEIPPRGAWMSRVVQGTSVSQVSSKCHGIIGHSRPGDAVVAKIQRACFRLGQTPLCYA
jgi:hypothetical protein